MRALLLAALSLLLPGSAAAKDQPCEAAVEVLSWTAEMLVDIRTGHWTGLAVHAGDLVAAANRADAAGREAAWPETYFGVLDELAYLSATIQDRGARADAAEAGALLGYADALAPIVSGRCGAGVVPIFIRPDPNAGDTAACPRVIDALARFKQAAPAVRATTGPFASALLLAASVTVEDASGEAAQAQWSDDSVRALAQIAADLRSVSNGDLDPATSLATELTARAAKVTGQARAICVGEAGEGL